MESKLAGTCRLVSLLQRRTLECVAVLLQLLSLVRLMYPDACVVYALRYTTGLMPSIRRLLNWSVHGWLLVKNIVLTLVDLIYKVSALSELFLTYPTGAIVFGAQVSLSTIKKWDGFRRVHIEPMYGDPEDSLVYCSKEDTSPFVKGTMPKPGTRNDLLPIYERLRSGERLEDIARDPAHFSAFVRYPRGLTFVSNLLAEPRDQPPIVFWLWGKTGTAKTRCCFEFGCGVGPRGRRDVWFSNGDLTWFDGYSGQFTAIFDDFRAKHVRTFAFLLRLLDRYPMRVPRKGDFTEFVPRVIFITAPNSPTDTFACRHKHLPEDIAQLQRRITKSFHFKHELIGVARARFLYRLATLSKLGKFPDPDEDLSVDLSEYSDYEVAGSSVSTDTEGHQSRDHRDS